jgi:farnesyl-diphosphate farnesyltransferase
MATRQEQAQQFCEAILPRVSRTFALSIRILPGTLGDAVRDAYLLCRIADTIEDAPGLAPAQKAALLDALGLAFDDPSAVATLTTGVSGITGEAAHVELARNADLVFCAYGDLPPATRDRVRHWVREMIAGMRKFVLAYPDGIRIQSIDEYREYCYYVAGTVGYLLTDLWHQHSSHIGASRYAALRQRCRAFAEALQTVNILKDVGADARHENSIYIPEQLLKKHGSAHDDILAGRRSDAAFQTLVELAWRDLDEATAYLLTLPRRAIAIRLFCALPLLFAYATLRDITRAPQKTAKISRAEVKSIAALTLVGVWSNRWMASLVSRTRKRRVAIWGLQG